MATQNLPLTPDNQRIPWRVAARLSDGREVVFPQMYFATEDDWRNARGPAVAAAQAKANALAQAEDVAEISYWRVEIPTAKPAPDGASMLVPLIRTKGQWWAMECKQGQSIPDVIDDPDAPVLCSGPKKPTTE
jgi:hypothetical protein